MLPAAAVAAADAFWADYWAASAIDITAGATANATAATGTLERWYYLSQCVYAARKSPQLRRAPL